MALEGTLESFSIAEIFQLIASQGKTGILEIDTDKNLTRIRFVNGQLLDAYPAKVDPNRYIGTMLVRTGLVTQGQLDYALDQQKRNLKKIGDILIGMGTLRTHEFQEMLALQRRETAYSLLRMRSGSYRFSPGEVDWEEGVDTLMNVDSILMEGSRQIDEWPAVLKRIPSENRVYRRNPNVTPRRELSREEVAVYGLLDGTLTVREVADRSRVGEFGAWSAMASLYDEGVISHIEAVKRRSDVPSAIPSRPAFKSGEGLAQSADRITGLVLTGLALLVLVGAFLYRPGSAGLGNSLSAFGVEKAAFAERLSNWENRPQPVQRKVEPKQKATVVLPSAQ